MIFADKLIKLRKKAGWSQEELAEVMNVSRQAVSKWEGAQTIPDLEKIIKISEIFGVSCDYLLKDEIELPDSVVTAREDSGLKRVSMEEANAFLKSKKETAKPIAIGTFLCILSPVCLFILGALSEVKSHIISENTAGGIGMAVMFLLIAAAAALFILSGSKTSEFEYLEKKSFECEYGVRSMVIDRRKKYKNTYTRFNVVGAFLCISALLPLFIGMIINGENDLFMVIMLSLMFVICGIGVIFFILGGVILGGYNILLEEEDYTREKKERGALAFAVYSIYWVLATAIYLAIALTTYNFENIIVFIIAGVLFPTVVVITNEISKRK